MHVQDGHQRKCFTAGCMTTSIEFFGALIKKQVTSKGADIDFADIGISISIPRQPFGVSVDSVDLLIRPCLSGPFILPEGYELASPVYVIEPSQQGVLQKPCTVRIQHYISLQNERDCDGMTFISAKIAPQTRWFGPYDFKEVKSSKQTFTPNSQVGEIELRHFCCLACARWFGKHLDFEFHYSITCILAYRLWLYPIQCKAVQRLSFIWFRAIRCILYVLRPTSLY